MTTLDFPTNPTEEQKQLQRQTVLEADVIYEWHCFLREKVKFLLTAIGTGGTILLMLLFCWLSHSFDPILPFIPVILITTPIMYHLGSVDVQYHGQITAKGIIEHKTQIIPDIFYKINRWMGYIGAVTCTLAAIFIGPAAFVGAGGFALMALVRGSREKTVQIKAKPWATDKPYVYDGPDIGYADAIDTYWYSFNGYRKTDNAGLYSFAFNCSNNSNILILLFVNTLTSLSELYRKKKNKSLALTAKLQANFIIPLRFESPNDIGDSANVMGELVQVH
ncbi:hypothetical protein L4C34_04405 [Vibrio profundum]|uniref:hypothetical protein n=1 Tax=Vibrio profundum TaxID=2910247 RepID=UPI003D0AF0F1